MGTRLLLRITLLLLVEIFNELSLDVAERGLGPENDRYSLTKTVINLDVSDGQLYLRERLLPSPTLVDIEFLEHDEPFN